MHKNTITHGATNAQKYAKTSQGNASAAIAKAKTPQQYRNDNPSRWFGALITVAAAVALVLAGCEDAAVAVDTTAPTVSDVQTSTANATTATITATVDEAGTLFWVVYTNGADKPANAAALITDAGKAKTDSIVTNSGSAGLAVSDTGMVTVSITGLTASSNYDFYAVAQDAAGNSSILSAKVAIRTTEDVTAPIVSGVQFTANGTTATITATVNEAGKLFWVVYVDETEAPANAAALIIDAGKAKADPIVANSGSTGLAVSAAGAVTVAITGLTVSSNYDFYAVAQDAAGNNSALSAKLDVRTALTVSNPTATGIVSVAGATVQLAWTNPDPAANNLSQISIRWGTAANQSTIISSGLTEGGQSTHSVTSLTPNTTYTFSFVAGYADSTNSSAVSITRTPVKVDGNNNTLIDIHTLDMLNNIRCNLAGTTYLATNSSGVCATSDGLQCGTAGATACTGYELMRTLDFATAGDYASGAINAAWRPTNAGGTVVTDTTTATNAGWVPIGETFTGIFDGNNRTISNLYVRSSGNAGLFNTLSGTLRNLGVINGNVYGSGNVGIVTAVASGTTIIASYASGGTANGGAGDRDFVGGLVGSSSTTIISTTIIASYASSTANGGAGESDAVGGLVGNNNTTIIASYATGTANGGAGETDNAGGLVGNGLGTIIASYATGTANGGAGTDDAVGGLVGFNNGTIIASYATGNANGGADGDDTAGTLTLASIFGITNDSYGFGTATAEKAGIAGTTKPTAVTASGIAGARQLTAPGTTDPANTATPATWDATANTTKGAWNFGSASQAPALVYADYDGTGSGTDYCALFPAKIPGTETALVCGTSLLPGQVR